MSRFRVLVADDEPLARSIVTSLVKGDAEIEAVVECGEARCVTEALARQRVDIAFLDIEMPEASGLQIASGLGAAAPVVVFITAFGSYATQAFDVAAVDYVLKPFSDERFLEALDRAKRRVRERRLSELAGQVALLSAELRRDEPEPVRASDKEYLQRFAFKEGDRSLVLKAADVVWIEAEDYYVLIHARQGRHMVRASLASLEQRLDPARFLRVHRTAIVNVDEVRAIHDRGPLLLTLSDGSEVAVSRSRRPQVEPVLRPRLR